MIRAQMDTAPEAIGILDQHADTLDLLPFRPASNHVSPHPADHAVQNKPAADQELLTRSGPLGSGCNESPVT
jgi:hypothetical protein